MARVPATGLASAEPKTSPVPTDRLDEWKPLFNGKDLSGWKIHPDQPGDWQVKNGLLVGSGPRPSHLFSERGDYTKFHLRVEAKLNQDGNSAPLERVAA